MKSFRTFWIIAFMLFSKIAYAQISLKVSLDSDGQTYKVYIVSKQSFTGINSLISSSQITILVPHGFLFSNLTSVIPNMKWNNSGRSDAPIENPEYDYLYFSFINNTSPFVKFDIIANQEILLFTFKRFGNCNGKVFSFDNKSDPFNFPNSLGVNTGNSFTVLGAGGDAYIGNTETQISVNLIADKTNPCAGSEVIFTAVPSIKGDYGYQWYVDDKPQGIPTASPVFKYITPKNENDSQTKITVKLIELASNYCDAYSTRKSLKSTILGLPDAKIAFNGKDCMTLPTTISVKNTPLAQYQWQENGQDITTEKSNQLQVQKSGTYAVKITKNGCTSTSNSQKIIGVANDEKILVDAGKDTTILAGESVKLKGKSDKATQFIWTPAEDLTNPNIAEPIAKPQQTTQYILTVSNQEGCPFTASVTINVLPWLYIPNAFSPNNDGLNDDWKIENIAFFQESTVEVFNRWGNTIFFSEGYKEPFDAKNLEATTYSYIIRTKYKVYRGTVEVLR